MQINKTLGHPRHYPEQMSLPKQITGQNSNKDRY